MLRSIPRGLAVAGLTAAALVVPTAGAAIAATAAPGSAQSAMCDAHRCGKGHDGTKGTKGHSGNKVDKVNKSTKDHKPAKGSKETKGTEAPKGVEAHKGVEAPKGKVRDGYGSHRDGDKVLRHDGIGFPYGLGRAGLLGLGLLGLL